MHDVKVTSVWSRARAKVVCYHHKSALVSWVGVKCDSCFWLVVSRNLRWSDATRSSCWPQTSAFGTPPEARERLGRRKSRPRRPSRGGGAEGNSLVGAIISARHISGQSRRREDLAARRRASRHSAQRMRALSPARRFAARAGGAGALQERRAIEGRDGCRRTAPPRATHCVPESDALRPRKRRTTSPKATHYAAESDALRRRKRRTTSPKATHYVAESCALRGRRLRTACPECERHEPHCGGGVRPNGRVVRPPRVGAPLGLKLGPFLTTLANRHRPRSGIRCWPD